MVVSRGNVKTPHTAREQRFRLILATPSLLQPNRHCIEPKRSPTCKAWSMTLQIFCALVSERLPPMTVKSWLKTKTVRPLISPRPVTCKNVKP